MRSTMITSDRTAARRLVSRLVFSATALTVAISLSASAGAATLDAPVAVVVTIPIPPQASHDYIVAQFEKSVPKYQQLPGLLRKYFTISDDHKFGGIYLWQSRTAAQAWFSDAWKAKTVATYGAAASVTYFEAPVIIEGQNTSTDK